MTELFLITISKLAPSKRTITRFLTQWICLAVILILSGCENLPILDTEHKPQAQSFAMRYKKYSDSGESLDEAFIDDGLQLLFPAIPGGIFGTPSSTVLDYIEVHDHTFTLNLPANIGEIAQPFAVEPLSISPQTLKIVRVETFHSVPNGPIGKGAFKNSESGNLLILVYFSTPARISGELENGDNVYIHDITIKQAGWNWIEMTREHDAFVLKRFEGSDNTIELALFVQNILNL